MTLYEAIIILNETSVKVLYFFKPQVKRDIEVYEYFKETFVSNPKWSWCACIESTAEEFKICGRSVAGIISKYDSVLV